MDSRQLQHPFSRNNGNGPPPPPPPSYAHTPFQSGQNQAPFPSASSSHPLNNTSSVYPEQQQQQQRRPSDSPYYALPSNYSRDAAPMPTSNHARHRSTSSLSQPTHTATLPRNMPPPSSPQQHHYHNSNPFPPPSINRNPPPALGAYQGGRDLPALSSINRPGSVSSSMSISSLLGAPATTVRESLPPQSQYSSAPSSMHTSNAPQQFAQSVQPSPRPATGTAAGFDRFRAPQTPESGHRREPLLVRDHRSNSAGSPPKAILSTPEQHRFGTPQSHSTRYSAGPGGIMPDDRRDQYFTRGLNPQAIPTRPSSQPVTYPGPGSNSNELARTMNDHNRHEMAFGRHGDHDYRRHVEEDMLREEERRRRELSQRPDGPPHTVYNPDMRESVTWNRRPESMHDAATSQAQNAYEYPRPPYAGPGREYATQDARYPPISYVQPQPAGQAQGPHIGSPQQDRRPQPQPAMYREGLAAMAMATSFRPQDSPHRTADDAQQVRHLGVQSDINRKGRNSPLPQAVQGAQSQLNGPASEPGIKNEFGKIFSGIGSGIGSLATSQAGTPGPTQPSVTGGPPRSDLENVVVQEVVEAPSKVGSRVGTANRRRKLKDEDKVDGDDSSAGRRTPSGNVRKRVKTGANGSSRQSATHKYDVSPQTEVAQTKNLQAQNLQHPATAHSYTSVNTPHPHEHKTGVPHHHHIGSHHHHHHHAVVPVKPSYVPIPKPRQIIRSHKVIDAVRHLPRKHLGHMLYELSIVPEFSSKSTPYSSRGFRSKSAILPSFSGRENCTFTIRVPRVHLDDEARQEITSNRPLWGTDVYTDDSDAIAAAIHSGWIKGAWTADVDASLLEGSEDETRQNGTNDIAVDQVFEEPPLLGPITPPPHHDIHLTILILPTLERYASTVRHGMKSREFGSPGTAAHDGLSYLIMSMKLVKGVDTANEAFGSTRRSRMTLSMNPHQDKIEDMRDESLRHAFELGGATATDEDAFTSRISKESFLRQSVYGRTNTPPSATHQSLLANKTALEISAAELLCGLGGGGWWNGQPQLDVITPPQEEPPMTVQSSTSTATRPVNYGLGGQAGRNVDLLLNSAASVVGQTHSRSISNGLEGLSEAAEAAEAANAMEEMGGGRRRSR